MYVVCNESMKTLETSFKGCAFKSEGYLEVMPPLFLEVIQTLSNGQNGPNMSVIQEYCFQILQFSECAIYHHGMEYMSRRYSRHTMH